MSNDILIDPATESTEGVTPSSQIPTPGTEAQQPAQQPAPRELPDKYRGKTLEEVVEMHQNAERELGRRANEIGTYRELVQTLGELKRSDDLAKAGQEEQPAEVTSDDLLLNPQGTISEIVKRTLQKELQPIRETQQASAFEREVQGLYKDFGDLESIGADPDFQTFVAARPSRIADAQAWLESRDIGAARRLLENWEDMKGTSAAPAGGGANTGAKPKSGVERAAAVATETSGRGGTVGGKPTYSRSQIEKMILTEPDRYRSAGFQKELHAAIREGRFDSNG